ncbi:hypothetical protein TNCT_101111 [Trichonephila clavata]|uniref:Uncharacterized protein n=1 Tax=Trichonephila clavata TaxID=2740835 RepID=A0A8X6L4Z6_TRICU|nr:hypothetical protein TNCT_101111 [Trichonephila clavata]
MGDRKRWGGGTEQREKWRNQRKNTEAGGDSQDLVSRFWFPWRFSKWIFNRSLGKYFEKSAHAAKYGFDNISRNAVKTKFK